MSDDNTWISNRLRPKVRDPSSKVSRVPEGMWTKCGNCGEILQSKKLAENLYLCSNCHFHFRMSAHARIEMLFDDFQEFDADLKSNDPLKFVDKKSYKDRLKQTFEQNQVYDSFYSGFAKIRDRNLVAGVFDFFIMGGSMGGVVGEKVARVFDHAIEKKQPAVLVIASGGARMQESIISLMQMSKTSMQISRMRELGLPFIAILTDPTTGGVAASYAMLADVIMAEPKALIGFAGPRVIEQTIRQKLPEGFQRSEFLLEHGFVDIIVERNQMKDTLYKVLSYSKVTK